MFVMRRRGLLAIKAFWAMIIAIHCQSGMANEVIRLGQITYENSADFRQEISSSNLYRGFFKFAIMVQEDGKLGELIFHPNQFKFHAEHLATLPEFDGLTPAAIDALALHNNGRKLLLGAAMERKGTSGSGEIQYWDVELNSKDPLTADYVKEALTVIATSQANSYPLAELKYIPNDDQRAYVKDNLSSFESEGISVFLQAPPAEVICYTNGWTIGMVKILSPAELETEAEAGRITEDDILVLSEIPRDLPIVAGIVVSTPSSPASHPALLADMLQVPFFYEPNAQISEKWQNLAASKERIFLNTKLDDSRGTVACDLTQR